jgi:alpha-glucosidase
MDSLKWWQKAVFYQIYPRSFADSNNDGIGDFRGISAKLDYLRDLGINAIWLSPHYPSPFVDCGYDIADYTGVDPAYGTLADFTHFVEEAHRRDIRVVIDLVLNHTSDQHPWFIEARSSLDNPKRDWYVWQKGDEGTPPNNWNSWFGGPAWEFDATTGQYYYHFFLKEQPDLNWRNPEVKQAMWAAVRFWLDLGVDGFRLDAISTIFEHPELPDHAAPDHLVQLIQPLATPEEQEALFWAMYAHQTHQPGLHELMQELRSLVDSYPGDRVLIGEAEELEFYGSGDDEIHLVFNFPLMRTRYLTPDHIRVNQVERLAGLPPGAWPCNTLGNHDVPRVWDHYGDGQHDAALARLHLALLLTLKGTPFLYYGEEIGMTGLELTDLSQFRDNWALNIYKLAIEVKGATPQEALKTAAQMTRDQARTPMQWKAAPNAGFSSPGVTTWLPVNPNFATGVNVADQANDPNSLLNFYRSMLRLRQSTPALIAGDYQVLHPHSEAYLAFVRSLEPQGQTCLVVLNFSAENQTVPFNLGGKPPRLLFSSATRQDRPYFPGQLNLAPFEIFIAELS